MSSTRARWCHKLDTPQRKKTVVRNAEELVPPTAIMIIQQKRRFVNSLFYTIFQQKFRQKRYIIEKIKSERMFFCTLLTKDQRNKRGEKIGRKKAIKKCKKVWKYSQKCVII